MRGFRLADRFAPGWVRLSVERLSAAITARPPDRMVWSLGRGALNDAAALEALYRSAADVADRRVSGDVVECGVYNGGSVATVARALHDGRRTFWLYDSFHGMPPAGDRDGLFAQSLPAGECHGTERTARHALARAGVPADRIQVRAGWFHDTFTAPLPAAVCYLHIDADWYDSVLLSLRTFYPLVTPGGVIVLDDFGWWEGARRAFYDFVAESRIHPLVDRAGPGQLLWIKGAAHHRHLAPVWHARGQHSPEFTPTDQ
ncbi:TylF/MycF/NovP-related O-methyltransferase [Frankia sp. CiP3]|uniref:TylF/MycF/NovP-related O-methyltransferase n=1 Tax=Frankia sp. CiP3 TaxID=2880971 RepID=UPI001EF72AD9|nr:TylF/MycF/NovP-related O-methyltransferase [Frankia sp. CiP3]